MARKKIRIILVGIALLLAAVPASAVTVELALVIDGSGSISSSDYKTQMDAYASAVSAVLPTDGSVATGVWIFGKDVKQVWPMTVIDEPSDVTLLASFFTNAGANNNRGGVNTGWTAIGEAIETAANALGNLNGTRLIIDVSTDGDNNWGIDPTVAAATAVTTGIDQVNCLAVGSGACNWIPSGSFASSATSFADMQAALTTKIARETGQVVPEPATMLLLGTGLGGLVGISGRRKRKKV